MLSCFPFHIVRCISLNQTWDPQCQLKKKKSPHVNNPSTACPINRKKLTFNSLCRSFSNARLLLGVCKSGLLNQELLAVIFRLDLLLFGLLLQRDVVSITIEKTKG